MGVPDLALFGEGEMMGVLDWGFESHWVPAFAGMTVVGPKRWVSPIWGGKK